METAAHSQSATNDRAHATVEHQAQRANRVVDHTAKQAHHAVDEVESMAHRASTRVDQVRDQAQAQVKSHPMKALGIAAAGGAVLGWLLRRPH